MASAALLAGAVVAPSHAERAHASAAQLLDTSFGIGGSLVVPTSPSSYRQESTRVFARPDGRIVLVSAALFQPELKCVGGAASETGIRTTIVVLTAEGTVEPSFSGGAPAVVCGDVRQLRLGTDGSLRFAAVATAATGALATYRNVVMAADGSVTATSTPWPNESRLVIDTAVPTRDGGLLLALSGSLVRLDANGRVDTSFGSRGAARTGFVRENGIIEFGDGSILLLSDANSGSVVRVLSPSGRDLALPAWRNGVVEARGVAMTVRAKRVAADRTLLIATDASGLHRAESFQLIDDRGVAVPGFGQDGRMETRTGETVLDATVGADGGLGVLTQDRAGGAVRLTRWRSDGTADRSVGPSGSFLRDNSDPAPDPTDPGSWCRLDALTDSRLVVGLCTAGFRTQLQVLRAGPSPLSAGTVRRVIVAGRGGVPADATTAILNVTEDGADADGYLSVQSCAASLPPSTSSVNFAAHRASATATVARLDADGAICVYSSARSDVLVDTLGWLRPGDATLVSQDPQRVIDTRQPFSRLRGPIEAGTNTRVPVAGLAGVPSEASTVILTVAVDQPASAGFVSLRSCRDTSFPVASTVNFAAGESIANLTIARLDADGAVCVFSSARTHVVVDAVGWQSPRANALESQNPGRVVDTRLDGSRLPAGGTRRIQLAGRGGVPDDARTVLLNVTADAASATGFLSIRSCLASGVPSTSTVNFTAGRTVANAAIVHLDADGAACVGASAATDLLVDVTGWQRPGTETLTTQEPQRILDTRTDV